MEEIYRGFRIWYEPPPIPIRAYDWHFAHEGYDGPGDPRHGDAASREDCQQRIDEYVEEAIPVMRRTAKMKIPDPVEIAKPEQLRGMEARFYKIGECTVIVGHEPKGFCTSEIQSLTPSPLRWHLSIAHPRRYPTWDEIMKARECLLPSDLVFAQILPGKWDLYVNLHPNAFHLWEVHDRDG